MKLNTIIGEHNVRQKLVEFYQMVFDKPLNSKGYRLTRLPWHPNCYKSGYVLQHRLIWELANGRFLKIKEIIHHVDHNKLNNNPDNLMLLRSNAEHKRIHKLDKINANYNIITTGLGFNC